MQPILSIYGNNELRSYNQWEGSYGLEGVALLTSWKSTLAWFFAIIKIRNLLQLHV